jgi:hypothetical protein
LLDQICFVGRKRARSGNDPLPEQQLLLKGIGALRGDFGARKSLRRFCRQTEINFPVLGVSKGAEIDSLILRCKLIPGNKGRSTFKPRSANVRDSSANINRSAGAVVAKFSIARTTRFLKIDRSSAPLFSFLFPIGLPIV